MLSEYFKGAVLHTCLHDRGTAQTRAQACMHTNVLTNMYARTGIWAHPSEQAGLL